MATAAKESKFSELVARITTLYNHASKAGDKVVIDALKASAKQAAEELLTLFDQFPVAHQESLAAADDRGSVRAVMVAEKKSPKSNHMTDLDRIVQYAADRGSDRTVVATENKVPKPITLVATENKYPKASHSKDIKRRAPQSLEEMIQNEIPVQDDPLIIKSICRHCKQERRADGSCACALSSTNRSTHTQKPAIKQEPIDDRPEQQQYLETITQYPERGYKRSWENHYPEHRHTYNGVQNRGAKRGRYY